jgi:misacylated tRNA(Ala) deacylase
MNIKTKLIYQNDCYIKEHESVVTKIFNDLIFFESTIFHPRSGGVENDRGYLILNDKKIEITEVFIDKNFQDVAHRISTNIKISEGTKVKMVLDWERRYRLMRLHTAAHIISAIMYNKYNALVSGGNINQEYAYDDYTIENIDKEIFKKVIEEANEIVKKDLEVKIYWLKREEALKIPGIVKLANKVPPELEELRIVEIEGIDIQADGGPHVKRTSEIGEIVLMKFENKGKNRKRLYFTVKP